MRNSSMMDMARQMTFHFSNSVPGGLLFRQWTVDSTGGLVAAVIIVFFMAVLYEGLKTLREFMVYRDWKHWKSHTSNTRESSEDDDTDSRSFLRHTSHPWPPKTRGLKFYSISLGMHLIQSALHIVQVGYAYILMLIVMTFNGWLFLSVSFGAGVGYLLFAKSRHLMGNFREQNDHCP